MANDKNEILKWHEAIKKKLAKIRVGQPKKVHFIFKEGIVLCFPSEKMWLVTPRNKKTICHKVLKGNRLNCTKYTARHLLRFAIINVLRDDS